MRTHTPCACLSRAEILVIFFDSGTVIDDKPPCPRNLEPIPRANSPFSTSCMKTTSIRSNRRVPAELLGGLDGDEPARGYILEQDREIAEKSGRTPLAIKSISRVGAKKK